HGPGAGARPPRAPRRRGGARDPPDHPRSRRRRDGLRPGPRALGRRGGRGGAERGAAARAAPPGDAAAGRGGPPPGAALGAMTPLLEARALVRSFRVRRGSFGRRPGTLRALDGVDLAIAAGESLGLVGESGSGKTTLGRCLVDLDRPTAGRVLHRGDDLAALPRRELARRRLRLPMVFQDPWGSLDPRRTAAASVAEALAAPGVARPARRELARELLASVDLGPELAPRYPHQLSGGQLQRVALARALACEPELIAADEPTSALDAATREQILALLAELRARRGVALLFIAHDLAAVEQVADRIAVLYAGR